eukprot:4940415-Pyramimonas_sp.AAC.1
MDYLQLDAVVTAEEPAASADSEARLAPADQQIDQAVLMPQLVDPVPRDGMEALLNVLVVAHRQSTAVRAVLLRRVSIPSCPLQRVQPSTLGASRSASCAPTKGQQSKRWPNRSPRSGS